MSQNITKLKEIETLIFSIIDSFTDENNLCEYCQELDDSNYCYALDINPYGNFFVQSLNLLKK